MTPAERIIKDLGGPTAISRETGFPVQTIHSWKHSGIPYWRKPAVIDAALRMGKALEPELAAYLASRDAA